MRICIVGNARGVHVATRARAFARRGHDVVIVSENPADVNMVRVRSPKRIGVPVFRTLSLLIGLAGLLRRQKADIYHIHYAASYGAWIAAALGLRPLVVSVMGGDILPDEQVPQGRLARWLTRQVLLRADLVTSKSAYLTNRLNVLGVKADRIVPMPWGVDLDVFKSQDCGWLRQELSIPDAAPVILSPRLLQPFYNIHLLIESFAQILGAHPSAVLLLTCYKADDAYRQRLVQQVADLEISKNVRFLGAIENRDMPAYYSLADISVSLAPSDGMPNSVFEAMACGTPTVLTRLSRYEEFFRHGENTWMTDLNPNSVSEAISGLIGDQNLRQKYSGQGVGMVRERADLSQHTETLEKEFETLSMLPEGALAHHGSGASLAMLTVISLVAFGFSLAGLRQSNTRTTSFSAHSGGS